MPRIAGTLRIHGQWEGGLCTRDRQARCVSGHSTYIMHLWRAAVALKATPGGGSCKPAKRILLELGKHRDQ
jgi:hypothetical protein